MGDRELGRDASERVGYVGMLTLRAALEDLAAHFAEEVLAAIRATSLEDLLGQSAAERTIGPMARGDTGARDSQTTSSGRRRRRSQEQIAQQLDQVVALVKKNHKNGLRAEQIRVRLGMEAKELPRILKEGLAGRKLRAKGQKRATTYFAA